MRTATGSAGSRSPSELRRRRSWGDPLQTPSGNAYLVERSVLAGVESWTRMDGGIRHDHRFFELVDGTIVASDWTALTTMNLTANINMTEKKGGPSAAAWTNTNADGTVVNSGASATNCEGFGDGNGKADRR